ncbi:MAG: hypothetical protein EBQ89_04560, partial [Alphaproteobacteria bacterium]|nr:hypothetical protein [Alphaproteobacteria bacterium]
MSQENSETGDAFKRAAGEILDKAAEFLSPMTEYVRTQYIGPVVHRVTSLVGEAYQIYYNAVLNLFLMPFQSLSPAFATMLEKQWGDYIVGGVTGLIALGFAVTRLVYKVSRNKTYVLNQLSRMDAQQTTFINAVIGAGQPRIAIYDENLFLKIDRVPGYAELIELPNGDRLGVIYPTPESRNVAMGKINDAQGIIPPAILFQVNGAKSGQVDNFVEKATEILKLLAATTIARENMFCEKKGDSIIYRSPSVLAVVSRTVKGEVVVKIDPNPLDPKLNRSVGFYRQGLIKKMSSRLDPFALPANVSGSEKDIHAYALALSLAFKHVPEDTLNRLGLSMKGLLSYRHVKQDALPEDGVNTLGAITSLGRLGYNLATNDIKALEKHGIMRRFAIAVLDMLGISPAPRNMRPFVQRKPVALGPNNFWMVKPGALSGNNIQLIGVPPSVANHLDKAPLDDMTAFVEDRLLPRNGVCGRTAAGDFFATNFLGFSMTIPATRQDVVYITLDPSSQKEAIAENDQAVRASINAALQQANEKKIAAVV